MTTGILGAGITGVTIQNFINHESELIEASDRPGGLCKSYEKDEFRYDIGGHILFSKNETVNEFVNTNLADNINYKKRMNKILFKDRIIKYPFENDLASLSTADNYECLIGYLKNDYPAPTDNLNEWSYHTFGDGISQKYFIPYNEKIWKTRSHHLALDWVERIPKPPLEDIIKSAIGIATEGNLHQLFFRYPQKGGAETLIQRILSHSHKKTICNYPIERIKKLSDGWQISNGDRSREYKNVVITFPIHEVVKCLESVPREIKDACDRLCYNSLTVVMIAIDDENHNSFSALYVPDPDIIFHRVCSMGFFSQHNCKPGTSVLIAEITTAHDDDQLLSDEEIIYRTLNDMVKIKLIKKSNTIATDIKSFKYAYPVHTLNRQKDMQLIKEFVHGQGLILCGRFAEFEYINSDECIQRAITIANKLNKENEHFV